jgi:hypothetical protein
LLGGRYIVSTSRKAPHADCSSPRRLQLVERSPLVDVRGSMLYVVFFGLLLVVAWPALRTAVVAAVALGGATLLVIRRPVRVETAAP